MLEKLNFLSVTLVFSFIFWVGYITLRNPLKVNKKGNMWLGCFILVWSSFWLDELLHVIFSYNLVGWLKVTIGFIQYFAPMLFYFSIVSFATPNFSLKKQLQYHLAHAAVFLILLILKNINATHQSPIQIVLIILMFVQSIIYTVFSYVKIKKHQRNIRNFSSYEENIDLFWLERMIIGVIIMLIASIVHNIFFTFESLSLMINSIALLIVLDFSYYSFRQKEIFPFHEKTQEEVVSIEAEIEEEAQRKRLIPDDELVITKYKLEQYMTGRKPYLDPELNLVKLADQLEFTPHKLSYIINTGFNRNFFQFINEYRVAEAKKLLLDPKSQHLSLLGIAFDSGFNSKTSFNTAFKKIVGQTPSDFKKMSSAL